MNTIGETLLDLFRSARYEVFIAAPFIKAGVMERVVENLASGVELTCITRWHPHEIKAGVSDLKVWDILEAHGFANFLLVPNLHAKFYRADDRYATGSANLTNAALGWSARPNIEILVLGMFDTGWREWEAYLLSQATIVDKSLVRHFERLVEDCPDNQLVVTDHYLGIENTMRPEPEACDLRTNCWLPITRYPNQLFEAYDGRADNISIGATESAIHDLLILGIPKGLDEAGFRASVAANLLQMPLVREVDHFLTQPRPFGMVRDFLCSRNAYPVERDPSTDWQTLMRWFQYFLPRRYQVSVPNHSEVAYRVE